MVSSELNPNKKLYLNQIKDIMKKTIKNTNIHSVSVNSKERSNLTSLVENNIPKYKMYLQFNRNPNLNSKN